VSGPGDVVVWWMNPYLGLAAVAEAESGYTVPSSLDSRIDSESCKVPQATGSSELCGLIYNN